MAGWANQSLTVTMDADYVYLQVGPEGFAFEKDKLRAIAVSELKSPEFLLACIAVACRQNNVNLAKPAQVKAFVEGRQWPW